MARILNVLVHITLLYTITICAESKLFMLITIHKKQTFGGPSLFRGRVNNKKTTNFAFVFNIL